MPAAFTATLTMNYQYSNMAQFIPSETVAFIKKIAAKYNPTYPYTRGGTDGARLSEMGLPCPNVWNGSKNYHSVKEFNVVSEAVSAINFLLELASAFQ